METELFQFENITRVEIRNSFFDLDLKKNDKNQVTFRGIIPDKLADKNKIELKYEIVESVLKVWIEKKKNLFFNSCFCVKEPAQLFFNIPDNIDIQIGSMSGNIVIREINTDKIEIKSGSGKLSTQNCSANMNISTGSGSVNLDNTGRDKIRIQTASGSINLTNCKSEIKSNSSSGSVKIVNCSGNKNINTASGKILAENSEGNLEAFSASGSHTYEYISGFIKAKAISGSIKIKNQVSALELETTSGSLLGEKINITGDSSFHAVSGSIKFNIVNNIKDFKFDLSSVSGSIRIGKTKASGRLVLGDGKIKIEGSVISGKQIYSFNK